MTEDELVEIETSFGRLAARVVPEGDGWVARLVDGGPRLVHVTGAHGADAEAAVEALRAGVERFGSRPAGPPAPPPQVRLDGRRRR